ncbi:hypothetical protein J3R30DRAFT_3424342 [Lentinula aciculospora]|uniref:HAMP domain-containing protein n=1 Tax=Lentinula aciculospora TaxID=153920 RepID=A0A9W9AWG8_9AGAR|nr:hypothetical protein J3R30DRAFT_3424342 [Lentinula aciculospora]
MDYVPFFAYLDDILTHVNVTAQADSTTSFPLFSGPSDSHTESILRKIDVLLNKIQRNEEVDEFAIPNIGLSSVEDASYSEQDARKVRNESSSEDSLKQHIHSIIHVCEAISEGDLSQRVTLPVLSEQGMVIQGQDELMTLKDVINTLVDNLNIFTADLNDLARDPEYGSRSYLKSQGCQPALQGEWHEALNNVDRMCGTWTDHIRAIAMVNTAICRGNLTQKLDISVRGEMLDLKAVINATVDQLNVIVNEVNRVTTGTNTSTFEGSRAHEGLAGIWKELVDNMNKMSLNRINEVRALSELTKAIHQGKLNKLIEFDAQGEMLEFKESMNAMVAQLSKVTMEIIRFLHEAGESGVLSSQVIANDFEGDWKVLVDAVNSLVTRHRVIGLETPYTCEE